MVYNGNLSLYERSEGLPTFELLGRLQLDIFGHAQFDMETLTSHRRKGFLSLSLSYGALVLLHASFASLSLELLALD